MAIIWGIPTQQKLHTAQQKKTKIRSHTPKSLFMLQSDWLKFEIELNSLILKRVSYFAELLL